MIGNDREYGAIKVGIERFNRMDDGIGLFLCCAPFDLEVCEMFGGVGDGMFS